ncbi:phosphatidylinositol phosphodiesterase, partial [Bacillus thuringiensis]
NFATEPYEEWGQVKNQLIKTSAHTENNIFLNHLSENGGWRLFTNGAAPYFVASGQYHKNTGGKRKLLTPFYSGVPVDEGNIRRTGIIAADFPGKSLIDSTIQLNNI